MKQLLLKRFFLPYALLCILPMGVSMRAARAQDDTAPLPTIGNLPNDNLPRGVSPGGALPATGSTPGGTKALKILEVGDDDVSQLRGVALAGADAISIGASLAKIKADGAAWTALAGWVRDGGVVFLHTDAAQLFGYKTVTAREGTNQLAGQLYGRARGALPLFAHPLLWSGAPMMSATGNLPQLAPSSRMTPELGVQIVYYQMAPGDALVVSHPNAVPILRVTDLAAPANQPLYACAVAPFGNGWAIFSPRLVEANRADGATFLQNLLRLVRSKAPSPFDAPPLSTTAAPVAAASTPVAMNATLEPLIGVPAPAIEALAVGADNGDWRALQAAWQKAQTQIPAAFTDPAQLTQMDKTARLLVSRSEFDALSASLASAAQGGKSVAARALTDVLRARLEWQRQSGENAESWISQAEQIAPEAAEVLLWRGVLLAARAADITLSSQDRAALYDQAAQHWNDALQAVPLARTSQSTLANAQAQNASISGVPALAVRVWINSAARAAQLMSVEPPLVSTVESELGGLVIRHFDKDPTLRTAIPSAALLTRSDQILGWDMDEEEILIFPNEQYYSNYSNAAGAGNGEMMFNPIARRGNVVGNRILMVSQLDLPVPIPTAPGQPPRFAQVSAAAPAILGRMHAQVLINALTQDGTPPPAWMQLGLISISNLALVSQSANLNNGRGGLGRPAMTGDVVSDDLRRAAVANALLTPDQFQNVSIANDRAGVIEAQARRLMEFFYARFGAGAVVETLQRLGAGETINDALEATTQMNETEFFLAWSRAEFGNGR